MCIVFACQKESPGPNEYRLVMVNNRDEYWSRPTALAEFWGPRLNCLSGRDMYAGKEGGTWLGMNKSGKIAVLLNILGRIDRNKKGRGFLVSDFISQDCSINDYAARIYQEKSQYNGFNLLLFDIGRGQRENSRSARPVYVTSAQDYPSYTDIGSLPRDALIGASNSPLEFPFNKVKRGKQRFRNIVAQNPCVTSKHHLVQDLLDLMADKTPLLPDPTLESAAFRRRVNSDYWSCRSAVNTWSPQETYGSRTTTIILVDGVGAVDYIERTVDCLSPDLPVTCVHKTFTLEPQVSDSNRPSPSPLPSISDLSTLNSPPYIALPSNL